MTYVVTFSLGNSVPNLFRWLDI